MTEKFAEALKSGDYVALSECFSEKCRYDDFAPEACGKTGFHVYGRKGVEMFFHNKFVFRSFSALDVDVADENTVRFTGVYSGSYIAAKAVIDKTGPDGLIEKITVLPALN